MQRELEHAEGLVTAGLAPVHDRSEGLQVVAAGADDGTSRMPLLRWMVPFGARGANRS